MVRVLVYSPDRCAPVAVETKDNGGTGRFVSDFNRGFMWGSIATAVGILGVAFLINWGYR